MRSFLLVALILVLGSPLRAGVKTVCCDSDGTVRAWTTTSKPRACDHNPPHARTVYLPADVEIPEDFFTPGRVPRYALSGAVFIKRKDSDIAIESTPDAAAVRAKLYEARRLLDAIDEELLLDPLNAELQSDRAAQLAIVNGLRKQVIK